MVDGFACCNITISLSNDISLTARAEYTEVFSKMMKCNTRNGV